MELQRIFELLGWAKTANYHHDLVIVDRTTEFGFDPDRGALFPPRDFTLCAVFHRGDDVAVVICGWSQYQLCRVRPIPPWKLGLVLVADTRERDRTLEQAEADFLERLAEDGQGAWEKVNLPRFVERRAPRLPEA